MPAIRTPETRYAVTADGVHIAYQVVGDGPADLVFVPGFVTNVELSWEWPAVAEFYRRLASFSRLILFDRRGCGLSDHVLPAGERLTLEARMDDIGAVLDATGSARATLVGFEDGFALCALFAATWPDRVAALVGLSPAGLGLPREEAEWEAYLPLARAGWGTRAFAEEQGREVWPGIGHDPAWIDHYAALMRRSVSPGDALVFLEVDSKTDVHDVLPSIRTPTLVLVREREYGANREVAQAVTDLIPGTELVVLPGVDHGYMSPDQDELLDQVERFVRRLQAEDAELDRVLATVLFTDVVGSTERAAELGDSAWRELLQRHHGVVRAMVGRYRGREVDTAGDGFFVTFDGPARGVRCAQAIIAAMRPLGLDIRAGLHTGEVTTIDGKVGGMAVHIGARVGALAGAGEVLVSRTVRDLVVGSGLDFDDAGEHRLKGVEDPWRLFRVVDGHAAAP